MREIKGQVMIDFDRFKNLVVAQNKKYYKKIGLLCAIIFVPLTIMFAIMLISEPNSTNLLYVAVSLLVAILGIMLMCKPFLVFYTRKDLVTSWFYIHGLDNLQGSFKNYQVKYEITLSENGVTEKFASGLEVRFPWFILTGNYVTFPEGVYFTYEDGKNSSLMYNLLGFNALLRDELNGGEVLFVSQEILQANPDLLMYITKAIENSKNIYTNKASKEQTEKLSDWVSSANWGQNNDKQ